MQPQLHNSADHGISISVYLRLRLVVWICPPSTGTTEPRPNRFHVCSVQKHESKETCNLLQQVGVRFLQTGRRKNPSGKKIEMNHREVSTTEPPNRFHVCSVQRHGSKETCNLLQQVGVRDSCRLEVEIRKQTSGGKASFRTTERCRPESHRKVLVVRHWNLV